VAGGSDVLIAYNRMTDETVLHMKGRAGNSDLIRLYNNTAVLPSTAKNGFYVGRGGRASGVTLRNNIIAATGPDANYGYSDGSPINSDYNIYVGRHFGKWKTGNSDHVIKLDQLFATVLNADWTPMNSGAPVTAVNSGTTTQLFSTDPLFTTDLAYNTVDSRRDRGAYEYLPPPPP
jgi:hypothetical protein